MQQTYAPQTRAIARHEATHVINAGLFGYTPIWFNEGTAEYFGSYTAAELKNRIAPANRYHLSHLVSLSNQHQLPSLQAYLQLSDKEWRSRKQQTMYAMAWSIIYLLQDHLDGERFMKRLMAQMAEEPCSNINALAFWEKNYPGGLAAFDKRWQVMLSKRP